MDNQLIDYWLDSLDKAIMEQKELFDQYINEYPDNAEWRDFFERLKREFVEEIKKEKERIRKQK